MYEEGNVLSGDILDAVMPKVEIGDKKLDQKDSYVILELSIAFVSLENYRYPLTL